MTEQQVQNGKDELNIPNYKFSDFKFQSFLNNNVGRKTVTVLGSFPNISGSDKAIMILEKSAFSETNFVNEKDCNGDKSNSDDEKLDDNRYFSEDTKVKTEFINNIYGNFICYPRAELNGIKTTVIYPATDKHIEKYSIHAKFLLKETPILYKNITEPYITSSQLSLDWVYNILEHKQEAERIAFEDTDPEVGFILLPDLKWDGHTKETLYMLAISHKRNIKSLRDLNQEHLPLLKNIRDSGYKAIKEKYDLNETQLRVYIHYQPSFYHIHVHFNALNNDAPGIYCEKSHLLDTVINNIELMPDYYDKATLSFVAFEGNTLLEKILKEIDNTETDGNKRKRIKLSED